MSNKISEKKKIITFDFDNTLTQNCYDGAPYSSIYIGPNFEMINLLKKYKEDGNTVYIVTRRIETNLLKKDVVDFVKFHKIIVDGIHFTNGHFKVAKLVALRSKLHYDDDPEEIKWIKTYNPEIETVLVLPSKNQLR